MEAIAALVGSTRRREWFVKDSFQSLDLDSLGFEPVFDAEWVALSGPPPDVDPSEYRLMPVTAAMAAEIFPGLPLVGYESGVELAAAHHAGFKTVGSLRVWRLRAVAP